MSFVAAVFAVSCQFGSESNSGDGANSVGDPSTTSTVGDGTTSPSVTTTTGNQSGTADGDTTVVPESTTSTSAVMPDTSSTTDSPDPTTSTTGPEPETDSSSSSSGDPATPEDACDMFFGAVPDYEFCEVPAPDVCSFSVTLGGGNCFELCDSLGSLCINAFQNDTDEGDACTPEAFGHNCFTNVNDEICVCTIP